MPKIKEIKAREILDSRGNPTIETMITLASGMSATASVPSGVSKSSYEALELRDNDQNRYRGLGVLNAVHNVNQVLAPKLFGMEVLDQQKLDSAMLEIDGTQNKEKLGANATLSISIASIKLAAKASSLPLFLYLKQFSKVNLGKKMPTAMFNLLEGGKHANNDLNFQEYLLIPASSKSFSEALKVGVEVHQSLKQILFDKGESILYAEEGGFSPNLPTNQAGLAVMRDAIEQARFTYAYDAFLGLDIAANSFVDGKSYKLSDRAALFDDNELVDFYKGLFSDYSLIYLEDPYSENDIEGWKKIYAELGQKTLIVGDDLTTTNPYRLQMALENKLIGGIIIKPNQIGTVTETLAVVEIARYKGLKLIVSHRAGETADDFIADLAVGIGADYVKFGAPTRERVVKYNRLLKIEDEFARI